MDKAEKIRLVQRECSFYLDKIAELFMPEVKITLVVRTPEMEDRDFTMSNDDLKEAIKTIERRIAADEQ